MALKKEDIQYVIDVLTFYNENTELKNDNATNLLGKAFGTSRSLKILNRALEECSHEETAALPLQNVSGSALENDKNPFDLPDYCKKRGGCNHSNRICYDPTMHCYLDRRNGD